jgi:hypothetical protein
VSDIVQLRAVHIDSLFRHEISHGSAFISVEV